MLDNYDEMYQGLKKIEKKANEFIKTPSLDKQNEERKKYILPILQEILALIKSCKTRGAMPPYGAIQLAKELANLVNDKSIDDILAEIIKEEREAVQSIAEKTGISPQELRKLEQLIATDPCAAAEYYFNLAPIKEMHEVIDQINKGESIPDDVKYNKYKKLLENTEDIRNRLAPKLAVEAEVLKKKGTEPNKLDRAEEHLEKLGDEKIKAAILRKHRHKPNKVVEIKEAREINNILDIHQIQRKDIAAVPETHLNDFVMSRDLAPLKQAITAIKEIIAQQAQATIAAEITKKAEELARREAEEAARVIREAVQKTDQVEQQEQIKEEVQVIDEVDRYAAGEGDKTKTVEMEDDLDAFLDDEPQPPSPPKEPHKFTPEIMRANKVTSSNHLAPSIPSGQKPSKTQGHGH